MFFKFIKLCWSYIKDVVILRRRIGYFKRKKFAFFGQGSVIVRPYLQIQGENNISVGNKTVLLKGCRLAVYGNSAKNSPLICIGDRCYIGFYTSFLCAAPGHIIVGNDVLIASNVIITNENHGIDPESNIEYMDQELLYKDVEIGDGCWIGEKVCILPGVKIGKKSVIGAGSVVTKSIPDFSIAVGNPAIIIKKYNFETHKWEKYDS